MPFSRNHSADMISQVAPTVFLAPGALMQRLASSRFNGCIIGLADVPGYLTSMVFFKVYPTIVAKFGWAGVMRAMQGFMLLGGCFNYAVWTLEANSPTTKFVA
jgi:hypothetical protein